MGDADTAEGLAPALQPGRQAAAAGGGAAPAAASCPLALLTLVFQRVLDGLDEPVLDDVAVALGRLAAVSRHWRAAALATPVKVDIQLARHLSPPARAWLSRARLAALRVDRGVPGAVKAARALFKLPGLRAASAASLRELRVPVDAGKGVPHLAAFAQLEELLLRFPRAGAEHAVDLAPLGALTRLVRLNLSGHFCPTASGNPGPDLSLLPPSVGELTLNLFGPDKGGDPSFLDLQFCGRALPPRLALARLAVTAPGMFVSDFEDLLARCQVLKLSAAALFLKIKAPGDAEGDGDGGCDDGDFDPHAAFAAAVGRSRARRVAIAYRQLYFSRDYGRGDDDFGDNQEADDDDIVDEAWRGLAPEFEVMPLAAEGSSLYVGDDEAGSPAYTLRLTRHPPASPRSWTFNGDALERGFCESAAGASLYTHPTWRLLFLGRVTDGGAAAAAWRLLSDPGFVAASASTLEVLSGAPWSRHLRLGPFAALRRVELRMTPGCGDPLPHLPPGLVTLWLDASYAPGHVTFDAAAARHLTALRRLGLVAFEATDLSLLPPTVRRVSLRNPDWLAPYLSEHLPAFVLWPDEIEGGGSASEWETCSSEGEAGGAAAAAAEAARGAPARRAGGAAAAGARAHYESDDDEDEREAGGHGADCCDDPYCPSHSGKGQLDLIKCHDVSLDGLVASGYPIILASFCCSCAHVPTLHVGGSLDEFVGRLKASALGYLELHVAGEAYVRAADGAQLPFADALRALEARLAGAFEVRSNTGGELCDGVHDGAGAFAVVRCA